MDFLYFLESIRTSWLNTFMLLITQLGDETAFLVVALILFWCVDKKRGYYVLAVGFLGTLANQFMKLYFRIPRPWVVDRNFTIVEDARAAATGYSFPSGHTQSSVGTFGAIAYTSKSIWLRAVALLIAVLVPLSRMYLGVHTPLDVFVAMAMAVLLILLIHPIVFSSNGRNIPILFGVMALLAVAFLCYVEFYNFPDDIDTHNLSSGIKNAYTLLGALLGLVVVYIVDEKWLHFPVKAIWWVQILKVLFGLGAVMVVKSGLKAPINALLGASFGTAFRYFLIVIVAGIVWPLTFRWFARIGKTE